MTTKPIAFLVLASCLAVATCGSCAQTARRTRVHRDSNPRLSAVEIDASCADGSSYRGSGIVIGPRMVLTAAHVVPCVNGRALVTDARGRVTPMRVEALVPFADLARLIAGDPEPFDGLPYAQLGRRPRDGAAVCLASAVPARAWRCGRVTGSKDFPPMNLRHTTETRQGNSGGGIYDRRGYLVGVVTHTTYSGGGYGTALDGLESMLKDGTP